ncbi:MAG: hypothetical protein Q8M26_09565 [Pseudolabrys sp.]|nr:hypothetical protein [Pseudolabrys sp.]
MDHFSYASNANIKRFENLLATSSDPAERAIIEKLLLEERAKAGRSAPP